ncbi:MAG TPA: thiamine-phosphate kinase [Pyrinomonadaceae bacterium]|nr:thiamine-phosphate kinase [Pyrinomonadaceae bacterium]
MKEHDRQSTATPSRTHSRTEFDFINKLRQVTKPSEHSSVVVGIGDDAAVIQSQAGKDTVVSADLLVEDVDFRRTSTTPMLLGHKALAVSLSDIAAMGARPRWALTSIGVPENIWESSFVNDFYGGLLALAAQYDVQLIGGDTSSTPERIVIDSILMGDCASGGVIKRAGAMPGDQIFVTGFLGGAAAGLRLIERGAHLPSEGSDDLHLVDHVMLRQLRPEPRVGWGLVLGQERLATAMIDISDGLSSDLHHLCSESGVGALIDSSLIPIDKKVADLCGRRALDPLQLALHGGEDFELLFTVSANSVSRLPRRVDGISITRVGEIRNAADGIKISEGSRVWELSPGGWTHF